MELRQLAYVLEIIRLGSFTRASETLHVAQPAISSQVRKLESELGVRLFERTSRRVVVTAAGEAFGVAARRVLEELETLRREMQEHADTERSQVRLGAWYTTTPELPELLAAFARAHSGIDLTIREVTSELMLTMLRHAELDVALPVIHEGLDLTDIEYSVFRVEPFVLIVAPESEMARRDSVRIEELDKVPMVAFGRGSSVQQVIERAFSAAGLLPRIALETSQLSTVRAYVAAGIGAAVVPRSVAEGDGPAVALIALDPSPERVSAIAWHRSLGKAPATQALIMYLTDGLIGRADKLLGGSEGHSSVSEADPETSRSTRRVRAVRQPAP
jgi:DNA-binding transcriptional LysR family regulator